MGIKRRRSRLAIALLVVTGLVGCESKRAAQSPAAAGTATSSEGTAGEAAAGTKYPLPAGNQGPTGGAVPTLNSSDHLRIAKQKLLLHDFDAAAQAGYSALLQDPSLEEATLIVGQAETARGNHQIALDLVSGLDLTSRFGKDIVEVRSASLAKLDRHSEAADTLLAGLERWPENGSWRRRVWAWLNRVGRRQEASLQAEMLCIDGQASQQEMLSLVRRGWSFPFQLAEDQDPATSFQSGLGMARWYFTRSDYRKGLEELAAQAASEFESPAACALYGRLLMECQATDEFGRWHGRCDEQVKQYGDYWAALGVYCYDEKLYEASARAFLEAVYRDPTDRETLQRLFKVFGSLERVADGQQFRHRGVLVSGTERLAVKILEAPAERMVKMELARDLVQLGRPFEMLQWSKMALTAANQRERAHIDGQIRALRQDPKSFHMASIVSLCGVVIDDYSIEPATEKLRSATPSERDEGTTQVESLALPGLVNVASQVGIDFQWYQDVEMNLAVIPIHESLGGGIGAIDYDLDGWPDVYLGQGSGDPPTDQCTRSNVLVRNLEGRFKEVTDQAGVEDRNFTTGVAAGDVNQDGFADLWIGSLGHNRLWLNNGDGTFEDITDRLNCDDQFTSSLAIGDINGDALPDLFEANYVDMEGGFALPETGPDGKPKLPGPLSHLSGFDRWFENLGDGEFRTHVIPLEVSEPGTSLGIIVTDFDANGTNEVFVGNDVRPNHFLFHQGGNVMSNVADVKGVANGFQGVPNGCMGISAADFNRDGFVDLYITNYFNESNNLFIQDPSGLFTDAALRYGLSDLSIPLVGFGTKAIDFDRNGWMDLALTNGHIFDTRILGTDSQFQMPPQLLMNKGRKFELSEVEDASGYWDQMYLGRAMTSLDFNRDGAVDLLIGHIDQPVAVLRNETQTPGQSIQLELIGTRCERDAIGARVVVHCGGESFVQWVTAGDGYLCSDEPVLDFGLGTDAEVVRVEVHWPAADRPAADRPVADRPAADRPAADRPAAGGDRQEFVDLQPNQRYLLVQGEPEAVSRGR